MSVQGKMLSVVEAFRQASDDEEYIAVIDRLGEINDQEARDELIAECVYNKHNAWLRAGNYDSCRMLLARYLAVVPAIGFTQATMPGSVSGTPIPIREGLAGDACALWNFSKHDEVWAYVEALLPPTITLHTLAYNLACSYSLRGDKHRLLQFAQLARSLGKPRTQFLADSDFADFVSDIDFLKAIS